MSPSRFFLVMVVAGIAASTVACKDAAPPHQDIAPTSACAGTTPPNGCITLKFSVDDSIRGKAHGLAGTLGWAIYHGGEVTLFGPGDHQPTFTGDIKNVDFTAPGATAQVTVPNVPAASYQELAYIDLNGNGDGDSGEAVTFPTDAFSTSADMETVVEVNINYVR